MAEMFEDLKRLSEMLERGEITRSEYESIKADLLAESLAGSPSESADPAEGSAPAHLASQTPTPPILPIGSIGAPKPVYQRGWFIALLVFLGIGAVGAALGQDADEIPEGLATTTTSQTSHSLTTSEQTTSTTAPTTTTSRPTTTTAILDPELVFSAWQTVFVSQYMPLFEGDFPAAFEALFYWIESVDRVTYDSTAHLLTIDATVAFESVYARDFDEWSTDTWDLYRSFSRDVWGALVEGFEGAGSDSLEPDWPRWTPAVRLNGNVGRLTVQCPGPFIVSVMDRQATQAEYESECDINN